MRPRAWLVGAALGFALGLALWFAGAWGPLETRVADVLLRVRGVERDASPFVAVTLDPATFRAWPEPTPVWGGHLANLVDALAKAGVRDIAFDVTLAPHSRDDSVAQANARLGDAILRHPEKIVLGYSLGANGVATLPAEELRLADAEMAFFELPTSVDGTLRAGIRRSGPGAVSLAQALARRRGGSADGPEKFGGDLARWKIDVVSATEVEAQASRLKGKSVVIGFAGTEGHDDRTLPVLGVRPGAEAQARFAATLWAGTPIRRLPDGVAALAAAIAVLLALVAGRPLAALAFLPLWLSAAAGLIAFGYEAAWVGPAGAAALASLLSVGGQAIDERALRRRIQDAFAYQIDEETFACLLANPALRQPGDAMEATATIMFLDVRSSTALGASVPNRDFFDRLNGLFERLLPLVGSHGGVVLSFAGDGFMAVFGAFRPLENDAQAAIDAALAMVGARAPEDPEMGVGLHRGTFLLGSLGGTTRAQFSAIGDAVNLASRVESQTKELGAVVLASAAVAEKAPGRAWGPPLTFVPKNHPRSLTVYRVAPPGPFSKE